MADLIWNGTISPQKTYFPKYWTGEKVLESITEAYENFIKSGGKLELQLGGKYCITGTSKCGLKIEMWITQKGKVLTAYPEKLQFIKK